MPKKIVVGTDGWRGHLAEDYTYANLRRRSQCFADYPNTIRWRGEWCETTHADRTQAILDDGLRVAGLK